ncbi:MAG TPA: hypothetical protein VF691_08535 [Cytophagaceae bacterium]|jgi:hypothetical protein
MKNLFLLLFLSTVLFLGCEKKKVDPNIPDEPASLSGTYELYLDSITSHEFEPPTTGTLIISHNALAVFPIDLSSKKRVLKVLGSNTINEVQTLGTCEGGGRTELDSSHAMVRLININPPSTNYVADISSISLEMPYYATQDNNKRTPGNLCVGFRIKNKGWVWHFTSVSSSLDDASKKGRAEIKVTESNVDAIAILFETTTNVSKISYEVK